MARWRQPGLLSHAPHSGFCVKEGFFSVFFAACQDFALPSVSKYMKRRSRLSLSRLPVYAFDALPAMDRERFAYPCP